MGSPDERATIMKLQDEVSAAIDSAGAGEFDGDEWGGNEASAAFRLLRDQAPW
jgi:hypothetical protein